MWDKLWEAIQKYGGSARDARIGAVGADQIRDLYKSDKELAKELNDRYLAANVAGISGGATAASALTAGVVPTLASEAGGAAGSYIGNKVGSYADEKLDTKWIAPTLSFVGGIGGGVGAYKGLKPSYNYLAKNGVIGYKDVPEEMLKLPTTKENPVLNVGWAPKQTINIKRAGDLDTMYYPERWDVTNEGANPFGVWLQGKFGVPRTDITNPGKGAKAAAARKIFADRKQYAGEVTLEKPIQTVGEIPNRSDLSYAAEKIGADGIIYNNVYDNGYNNNQVIFSFKKPSIEQGYKFYERPSKLSDAEKMGIPKVDRYSLNQDKLDALEDLINYNKSGRFRWRLTYDGNRFYRTNKANIPQNAISGTKALLEHGAKPSSLKISLRTKKGNWHVWNGYEKAPAAFTGGEFPVPDGMKWAPGELSLMLNDKGGKELKVIMTSPRVDAISSDVDNVLPKELIESLPNTIDKNIMRRFWRENDELILPGSYLSGDNGHSPLGKYAISAIDKGEGMTGAISHILHPDKYRPHAAGLSPDSMLSILKQGQRDGHAVRYGPGFTHLNSSAVYNKDIYDNWMKWKSGEMSTDEFKTIFDNWFVPQGGRPLEVKTTPKFLWHKNNDGTKSLIPQKTKEYVIFPHPYVHYKKQGGKLNNNLTK